MQVASLPALLSQLRPEPAAMDSPVLPPPRPGARARLLAEGHTVRRRHRTRQYAAGAVLLPAVVAAVLLVPRGAEQAPSRPALVAMERPDPALDVAGSLGTQERSWGTAVTVRMRWAKESSAVLVAVGRDGVEQDAGWWRAPAGEEVFCTGATSLAAADVARWEVRDGAGTPLLVLPA